MSHVNRTEKAPVALKLEADQQIQASIPCVLNCSVSLLVPSILSKPRPSRLQLTNSSTIDSLKDRAITPNPFVYS